MKNLEVYDIEVLHNFFSYCGYNIETKKWSTFIIHESKDETSELISHLYGDSMLNYNGIDGLIGFNNLSYDSQIIQYLTDSYKKWIKEAEINFLYDLNGTEITKLLYDKSQSIIESSNKGGFPEIPEWKLNIPQLDLFKIWHFDNKSKMTSLKWVEFMLDIENLLEMPIKHYNDVSEVDIPKILEYNKNDVLATYELYKLSIGDTNHPLYKGVDKIQLRKDIIDEFDINCINYNDVKIGDEINKKMYCLNAQINKKQLPASNKNIKPFQFKDCFPDYYKFETLEFNNFINGIKNIYVDLDKKQQYNFTYNGTTYTIAKGGIHSNDKPRKIVPNEDEVLIDADIGSQYPNALAKRELYPRHLGKEWLIGYKDIIQKRIQAKKDGKKAINEAYKLSLNGGGYGKLGEEYSWQYDPFVMNCVTIGNQIELLMLIEKLEINGIHCISANTDGIVCLFNNNSLPMYYALCIEWEKQVGNYESGKLEYSEYSTIVQTSVNDYIAIKKDSSYKTKGDFVSDFEIHKNKSKRIIPLSLQQYFVNNIKPEDTVYNSTNIFDFCSAVKGKGIAKYISLDKETQEERELQKINRYYISTKGVHLLKRLPKLDDKKSTNQIDIFGNIDDGTREHEVESTYLSTIFNTYIKKDMKDYNINYKFYIDCIYKIINQIQI